jgi:hypothetical protein
MLQRREHIAVFHRFFSGASWTLDALGRVMRLRTAGAVQPGLRVEHVCATLRSTSGCGLAQQMRACSDCSSPLAEEASLYCQPVRDETRQFGKSKG